MLSFYDRWVQKTLDRPNDSSRGFLGVFILSFLLYPLVGLSFFPRTDAGQFVINLKAPTGTRLEVTEDYVKRVEDIVHQVVRPGDLNAVVSNIGVMSDLSALTTPNSAMHTAFIQVGLKENHEVSSFAYMAQVRSRIATELPQLRTYFQSGGLVDSVLNQGMPAPIDVQVSGMDLQAANDLALDLARKFKALPGVSDVYVPQDMDYPALQLNVNRERASQLGLDPKEVVDNLITALTSDAMIAPSYWVDPKSGNNYFVTVQYPENQVKSIEDLKAMPLRAPNLKLPTYLNQVADVTPNPYSHRGRSLSIAAYHRRVCVSLPAKTSENHPRKSRKLSRIRNSRLTSVSNVRGLVTTMNSSFRSFGFGLLLSVLLGLSCSRGPVRFLH